MDSPQATPMSDDLSALAWVQEEVRKSLEAAHKALHRCLKEAEATGFSDVDALDPAVLRSARQQIHQGVGALELAGLPAGAMLLRASEAVVQRIVARPQSINERAIKAIEAASFALLDLMRRRLAGKPVSGLALFPQYEALMALSGSELARPSDLWVQEWPPVSLDVPLAAPADAVPRRVDEQAVAEFETTLLQLLKGAPVSQARRLVDLCGQLAADAQARQAHREGATWVLACGFLEALADGRLPLSLHVKRVLSALLSQLRTLARQPGMPSDRLAHELLFFCAQAESRHASPAGAGVLDRLREAFRLGGHQPVDLVQSALGRFDPAWVAQAIKRVTVAKEAWSSVAGGELLRLSGLHEPFSLVSDSIRRLYPDGESLGQALLAAADATVKSGVAPEAALAMEVATSLLYLEASLDEAEFEHPEERQRVQRLAQRLQAVLAGQPAEPLEPWMEALYRQVSDRQTIGSVVQELRTALGESEKRIDQFFRDHDNVTPLVDVPSQLQSMKGVLAVLGLDAAAQAVSRMRGDVESLLAPGADLLQAAHSGVHDRLASNLGAVGFLVDMLAVQPGLAKHLFVFNADNGVLSPIMGRAPQPQPDVDPIEVMARPAEQVERVRTQEVAETLAESVVREDVPLSALSDELQHLADTPLVQDQPSLAASLANAQAALDRAAATDDQAEQQQARDEAVAALNDFVQSVTEPAGVDEPIGTWPEPVAQAPLVPEKPVTPEATGLEEDDEMRDIFIEEAREVIGDARAALAGLSRQPDDVTLLTTVRRAFHTLKGSSRMVGLGDFGDAAWGFEQLYNAWLASQNPANDELMGLSIEALTHLERWVDAIAAKQDRGWSPTGLVQAAEALRLHNRRDAVMPPDGRAVLGEGVAAAPLLDEPLEAPIDMTASDAFAESAVIEPRLVETLEVAELSPQAASLPDDLPDPVPEPDLLIDAAALPAEIDLIEVSLVDDDAVSREAEAQALAAAAALHEPQPLGETVADVLSPPEVELPARAGDPVRAPPLLDEAVDLIVLDLKDDVASRAAPLPFQDTEPPSFSDTQPSVLDTQHSVLDTLDGLPEATELPPDEPLPDEPLPQEAPPAVADTEILALPELNELAEAPLDIQVIEGEALDTLDMLEEPPSVEPPPEPAPSAEPLVEPGPSDDEQVKVIGPLRISIPLFNIYLNEADEQSRRLSMQLGEWALEWQQPIGDEAVALAHSLAGNSGTVGYTELSRLARALEHALARSQSAGRGDDASAALFNDAAEEIRRLLHQFAAGFLKSPNEELLQRLEHYEPPEPLRADVAARQHLRLVRPEDDDGGAPDDVDPPLPDDVLDLAAPPTETVIPAVSLGLPEVKPFEPLPEQPASEHLVRAVGTDVDLGADADIEAVDAIDGDLFPIFEEEALELLPQLAADMRQWVQQPQRRDLADACMRTLHTFKGGARLAGAMRLGELAHRMESAIERLIASDQIQSGDLEPLEARGDVLAEVFESLQRRDLSTQQDLARRPASLVAASAQEPSSTEASALQEPTDSELAALPSAQVAPAGPVAAPVTEGAPASVVAPIDWSSVRGDFQPGGAQAGADTATASSIAAVRVRPRLLDRLVNHAGEVSIARTRLSAQMQQMRGSVGDLTDNLDRLRQQLRDIELQAETQLSTRMEAARAAQQNFDPLEFDRYTRFQELTRMMAESVNDVATVQRGLIRNLESAEDQLAAQSRLTRDLQDDLLRTRMVEFEGLSDRLYRVVRQAAKETGKQVRLDLVGGHTEVDRGVLDRMAGAFEHLLRNSVTHGVEDPATRQAQGKEPMGTIIVAVHQEGNEVAIEFRDDGAGLDLARIRGKAEAQGLLAPGADASEAELAQLIFTPGLSTAETVTELAGRGIGMDVVRADVNAMGGRIETATAAGQGTSFKLILPLTTAVTKVVMVRCGDLVVSIPTNLVELVRRARAEEIEQAYASGSMPYADLTLPFFWFGALLQHSPRGTAEGRSLPVVVVRSAQQRVALHVDEVLGNQDVVVKNLGPQLSRVPGLAGMTLLASGAVALIYNPVALATVYGNEAQAWARQARLPQAAPGDAPTAAARPQASLEAPAAPLVLVVDDSLTVRRVTQRLLTREGYRVALAKDGLEALEKMAEEIPLVVLSDIEMPRMDGFDLVRNLRGDERWKDVPIVMITSRIAQKHRDYAAELGVNHYLGKPYSEEELVSLVARYTHAALSQQGTQG